MRKSITAEPYIPTEEDFLEEDRRFKLYEYYGIIIGVFSGSGTVYTDDELRAMDLIRNGKKLPEDLEKRLLDTKEERIARFNLNHAPAMTKEVRELIDKKVKQLGIKF